MINKKNITSAIASIFLFCNYGYSQTLELNYTSELQTDFQKSSNWANLLRMGISADINSKFSISATTLSFAHTNKEPLINDYQIFSNIEAENIELALSKLGMQWNINEQHSLFAGIRNMNEDYFISPVTSLFTNSSCGILPTVASFPIANYPFAAVGIHYKFENEKISIQSSLYNGEGHNKFTGRNNIFRVCPKSDGVFGLLQGEYKYKENKYYLGGSLHYGELGTGMKIRNAVWTYAEQRIAKDLDIIAAYSHSFTDDAACKDFAGIGAKYNFRKCEFGVFSDYAAFSESDEWATEITCNIGLTDIVSIQPATHIVTNNNGTKVAGILRLCVSL